MLNSGFYIGIRYPATSVTTLNYTYFNLLPPSYVFYSECSGNSLSYSMPLSEDL